MFRALTILCLTGCLLGTVSAAGPAVPVRGGQLTVGDFHEPVMPPLPQLASPVDVFRELLALAPEARERAILEKPEPRRGVIRAKLAEYAALPPEEREIRLHVTELRWRLVPMMNMNPTNRASLLHGVPLRDRALIQERLRQWDQLPPAVQKELLENQATLDYFGRLENSSPQQRAALLQTLPEDQRARMESDFNRWHDQTPRDRERLHRGLTQFFELTTREREVILARLPASQRSVAQQTLGAIANLPEEQRARCLDAYRKFTTLSPAEREQFTRNAERWMTMSEVSRDNWRKLARTLPPLPPLPPGLAIPPLSSAAVPR